MIDIRTLGDSDKIKVLKKELKNVSEKYYLSFEDGDIPISEMSEDAIQSLIDFYIEEDKKHNVLPFGKYKGQRINETPIDYLRWLLKQDWLKYDLKKRISDYVDSYVEDVNDHEDNSYIDFIQDDYDCPYDEWDAYGNLMVDFGC